ncbi:D-arabinono-1,4-lactone oxidase [Nocardia sp. NPDC051570]|uniref:D-arabinono-1,4-lactone oxidase n=1 Tax=Nocardia sp. NPDC051570 TaxID=3364324 RepID=UPI0037AEB584
MARLFESRIVAERGQDVTSRPRKTWGGAVTLTSAGTTIIRPRSRDELIEQVRAQPFRHLRVIGSGHSFNDIAQVADADGAGIVVLDRLNRILSVNRTAPAPRPSGSGSGAAALPAAVGTVVVEAGITLDALLNELLARGLTLVTVGAIREQTVAGAISTGTHGASIHVGSYSSLVMSLTMLCADGTVRTVRRDNPADAELFRCCCVSLGALGIIIEVELEVVDAFAVRPVSRMLTMTEFLADGEAIARAHPYARFYYFPYTDTVECVTDIPVTEIPGEPGPAERVATWVRGTLLEYHLAQALLDASALILPSRSVPLTLRGLAATRRTREGAVDWSYRHMSLRHLPPRHNEGEWSVPLEHWRETVAALHRALGPGNHSDFVAGFLVSLRFVGSDGSITLSNNYQRPNLSIDLVQFHRLDHTPYLTAGARIIRAAAHGQARPHWGKMFDLSYDELAPLYPNYAAFIGIRKELDPHGVFTNSFTNRVLGTP